MMARRYSSQRFLPILIGFLSIQAIALSFQMPALADTEGQSASGSESQETPVETINRLIRQGWKENGLRPSKQATEGEWCRRVYLDLLGRVPTVEELKRFSATKSSIRRRTLVEQLLGSKYEKEFARNWSTLWTNILVGRTGGRQRRSLINRSSLEDYLMQSILERKPYDQLAVELVTAVGSTDPSEEDFNGAVNYLVEKLGDDGVQATVKTSQIFLGSAVQCTQCHNHPFNEYRQNQFWELNAFFRQTKVERTPYPEDDDRYYARVEDRDFAGEGRRLYSDNRSEVFLEERDGKLVDRDTEQLSAAPIYYELRNGQMRSAFPVFVDGTSLVDIFSDKGPEFGNSGYLKHVNRRKELAPLLTGTRDFDRAIVNRMWAHFFGFGFTRPFDDMGPHNLPSHPELLDELGLAFRDAEFDMKSLLKWIVLSEPYSLSSRIGRSNSKDDPTKGVAPQFSRFYVRQMQAEQLYESLLVSTQAEATIEKDRRSQLEERWLRQFNTAFGTDDGAEATSFNGSIPQTLTLMNGELIRRACSTGSGSFLDKIANDESLSNRKKINYLYLAALARQPSKEETKVCNALLASRKGDVVGTLQDIWWAVLNCNEFILVH